MRRMVEELATFLAPYPPQVRSLMRAARSLLRRQLRPVVEMHYDATSAVGIGFSPHDDEARAMRPRARTYQMAAAHGVPMGWLDWHARCSASGDAIPAGLGGVTRLRVRQSDAPQSLCAGRVALGSGLPQPRACRLPA